MYNMENMDYIHRVNDMHFAGIIVIIVATIFLAIIYNLITHIRGKGEKGAGIIILVGSVILPVFLYLYSIKSKYLHNKEVVHNEK